MDQKKPFAQNFKEEAKTALDRTDAKAQQAKGAVKESIGKATDNIKLKTEGKVDQIVGKAKDTAAKVKDNARDASEKTQKESYKKH